jgi:hypothetical protein
MHRFKKPLRLRSCKLTGADVLRRLGSFIHDTSGSYLVFVPLLTPILIGVAAPAPRRAGPWPASRRGRGCGEPLRRKLRLRRRRDGREQTAANPGSFTGRIVAEIRIVRSK